MSNKALFAQLKQKFTTDTVIKRAGGKYLKVSDFNGIQAFGNLQQNTLANRYTRLYSNNALVQPGIGYGMQATRAQLYMDYEAMDLDALVGPALDILCEEATQVNEMNNEVLSIRSSSENIQDELYNLFYNVLNIEFNLPMWIRGMTKFGDFFLLLRLSDQFGVYGARPLSVYEITREEGLDANNGDYIRFIQDPGAITGGVSSIGQSRNHRVYENYEVAHFRLIKDASFLPYGKCLKGNSYIETEFGVKTIDKIEEGDKVWSYNVDSDSYELTTVLKQICSGEKEIFKVSTKNNFIEGSAEHPVLVFSEGELKYKQIQDLSIKDLLAITDYQFKQVNPDSKLNKDVSKENKKNGWQKGLEFIPEVYEEDFARLFGFLLGDGWTSKACVAFAQGVHDDNNQKYKDLLQKYSGKVCGEHNRKITNTNIASQAYSHSKALKVVLINNGFVGKAKTKRFPSWIYEQPENVQLAFIEGLVDADGAIFTDRWNCNRYTVELANKEMLGDLKVLLQRLKIKSGKIQKRKPRTTVVFGDKIYDKNESYILTFYTDGKKVAQAKKHKQEGIQNVILEPIVAIEQSGKDLTYDIYVESENHNFIANGIIVHNSYLENGRKLFKAYTMMEDAAVTHRVTKSAEKRIFYYNVGNLPPNEVDAMMQKHISSQKRSPLFDHKTGQFDYKFNIMNLMEDFHIPVRNGDNLTRIETAKGLEYTGMDDMNYFINKMFSALKIPKAYLNYSDELNGKCLHPDTKIPLLNGTEKTIKEISDLFETEENVNLWVYSYDKETNSIIPGKVVKAEKTRRDAKLVKVTLDNGESLITTPDHGFVRRGGERVEAQELKEGDSLQAVYRKFEKLRNNQNDYEHVYQPNLDKWVLTHKMVDEYFNGKLEKNGFNDEGKFKRDDLVVVHHKDFNRYNNQPDNLQRCTYREHSAIHVANAEKGIWSDKSKEKSKATKQGEEYRKKASEIGKVNMAKQCEKDPESKNRLRNAWLSLSFEEKSKIAIEKVTESTREKLRATANRTLEKRLPIMQEARRRWAEANPDFNRGSNSYRWIERPSVDYIKSFVQNYEGDKSEINGREKLAEKLGFGERVLREILAKEGRDIVEFLNEYIGFIKGRKLNINKDALIEKLQGYESVEDFCKQYNFKTKSVRILEKILGEPLANHVCKTYNHKVVSVEFLDYTSDTYNMEVYDKNENHNFLTSAGVIIKNSTLSGLSLSWSRQIEYVQRMAIAQLQKIAQVHLTLLGYEDSDLANFDITLARPSILHEQERIALLKEKVDLANQMQEKNFMSTDWVYDNIFQMSEDQINRERGLIAEDAKRKFRYTQIEQEGNDPSISGVSYGTPHDLASIYKNNASGPEDVPSGYDEKKVVGRPVTHHSIYNTDKSPEGRDPLGKKDMKDTYKKDSLKPNPRKGMYNEGLSRKDLDKIRPGKKIKLYEEVETKELSILDERNLSESE